MKELTYLLTVILVGHGHLYSQEIPAPQMLRDAKVTLKVIGANNEPIQGAEARVSFETRAGSWGEIEPRYTIRRGMTDLEGEFTGSAHTDGLLYYGARKEGYYNTESLHYDFIREKLGRWEPWNPVLQVVLKRIGHPIAMYAKKVQATIPRTNEVIGFDLMMADWVAPYGTGKESDFGFFLQRDYGSRQDYRVDVRLSFFHRGDGIQPLLTTNDGSQLRLFGIAPQGGYRPMIELTESRRPGVPGQEPQWNLNYYFRIRAEESVTGNILRTMYGKIYGDIYLDGMNSTTCLVLFTYYLNPDGAPNVEFDPKQNLFRRLKTTEQVRDP